MSLSYTLETSNDISVSTFRILYTLIEVTETSFDILDTLIVVPVTEFLTLYPSFEVLV